MSRRHDESKTAPDPWGTGWGEYAAITSLPNTAAGVASDLLRKGDHATVGGHPVVCADPTVGAAVWYYMTAPTGATRVFTQPVNLNAANLQQVGTDAAAAAATDLDYVEFEIPYRKLCTGAAALNGTTVGTDLVKYGLYNSAGVLIATTDPEGTLGAGADVFQQIAFATAVTVSPGRYFFGLKVNGTTHCHQRASAGSPMRICEREGSHVFLTSENITSIATTFTADRAPIGYVYT